ncbi:MAG: hypothetical protein LBH19_12060 [Dysgonamonadaceae bacterium]|jgi:hypothetical protein|nr:hypothetical protein [Dysgonamonadaceae bacterium]
MKKIFYIVALCCTFAACDKTENEDVIKALFIGAAADEKILYEYDAAVSGGTAYSEDFSSGAGVWETDNGASGVGTASVQNGNYVVSGLKDYALPTKNLSCEQSRDFQLDVYLKCDFSGVAAVTSGKVQGLVFGYDGNGACNFFLPYKNWESKLNLVIGSNFTGNYTSYKTNTWFSSIAAFNDNAYHLYTIRKAGGKLIFFFDKAYQCEVNAFNYGNYGFIVPKGGKVSVDFVREIYVKAE